MKLTTFTSIGRPIDPSYPTNRAIGLLAIAVILAGTVFQVLRGVPIVQSGIWGLGAGIAVFLAWAICRELDPDNDLSAFVATGFAIVGLIFGGLPNLGILFWLLLVVRVVNRTTGLPATLIDSLAVVGFGGWLSFREYWAFGIFTAIALFLDYQLPPANRQQNLFAGISAVIAAVAFFAGGQTAGEWSLSAGAIATGFSLLFLPVFLGSRRVTTVADESGETLNPVRVQAGQALALSTGIATALWSGEAGLIALLSLWAAVLGAGLYRLLIARQ